jgi:hypothetical protein
MVVALLAVFLTRLTLPLEVPAYRLTPRELYEQYLRNEHQANALYLDQLLENR